MNDPLRDYQIGGTLGKGAFGKVKKATHRATGQKVAIKFLQKRKMRNEQDRQRVKRQIKVMKMIRHPHLLKLLQVIQAQDIFYLVTELIEGEELFQKINRLGRLDQQSSAHYFLQLLDAVLYLQKLGICHRDIKAQNIIVRGNSLKLIDFGLSNFYQPGQMLKTSCGSPCYAAPEMMSEKNYDPSKSQIWAIGVTLYAMLTGKLPFEHSNTNKLYKLMATDNYDEVHGVSSSLRSLLKAMIQPNPALRISAIEISQHIWVKSYKYNFQTSYNWEWSSKSLQRLSIVYHLSQEQLKDKILNSFGPERTHYFLDVQREQNKAYNGPLHLSLATFSLKSAQQKAKTIFPKANWINEKQGQLPSQSIKINQLLSANIYSINIASK